MALCMYVCLPLSYIHLWSCDIFCLRFDLSSFLLHTPKKQFLFGVAEIGLESAASQIYCNQFFCIRVWEFHRNQIGFVALGMYIIRVGRTRIFSKLKDA